MGRRSPGWDSPTKVWEEGGSSRSDPTGQAYAIAPDIVASRLACAIFGISHFISLPVPTSFIS